MILTRSLVLTLTAGLTLTACNDTQSAQTTQTATTQNQAAASAATTEPDVSASAASATEVASAVPAGNVTAGKSAYVSGCAGCHGAAGAGGLGPALAESAAWSAEDFAVAIRKGQLPSGDEMKTSMPRFTEGQLSGADLTNVHSYLASLN